MIKKLLWRFKRWLNKTTELITQEDYTFAGYKHLYRDIEGKKIYFKKTYTYEEKVALRREVIDEFGHLIYMIKIDLQSGESRKISLRAFKNSIVKQTMKHEFEDAMVNWEDTPEKNIVINKLLENEKPEEDSKY